MIITLDITLNFQWHLCELMAIPRGIEENQCCDLMVFNIKFSWSRRFFLGCVDYNAGDLLPPVDPNTNEPRPPRFAQVYVLDPEDAKDQRLEYNQHASWMDDDIIRHLQSTLATHPIAELYKSAKEIYEEKCREAEQQQRSVIYFIFFI